MNNIEQFERIIEDSKRFRFATDSVLEIQNYFDGRCMYIDFKKLIDLFNNLIESDTIDTTDLNEIIMNEKDFESYEEEW